MCLLFFIAGIKHHDPEQLLKEGIHSVFWFQWMSVHHGKESWEQAEGVVAGTEAESSHPRLLARRLETKLSPSNVLPPPRLYLTEGLQPSQTAPYLGSQCSNAEACGVALIQTTIARTPIVQ